MINFTHVSWAAQIDAKLATVDKTQFLMNKSPLPTKASTLAWLSLK